MENTVEKTFFNFFIKNINPLSVIFEGLLVFHDLQALLSLLFGLIYF